MTGNPKVLLLELSERTSGKGNCYMSGWLGKARVVGFREDEPDKYGNPLWRIYVAEPESRSGTTSSQPKRPTPAQNKCAIAAQAPIDAEFNDSLEGIGR